MLQEPHTLNLPADNAAMLARWAELSQQQWRSAFEDAELRLIGKWQSSGEISQGNLITRVGVRELDGLWQRFTDMHGGTVPQPAETDEYARALSYARRANQTFALIGSRHIVSFSHLAALLLPELRQEVGSQALNGLDLNVQRMNSVRLLDGYASLLLEQVDQWRRQADVKTPIEGVAICWQGFCRNISLALELDMFSKSVELCGRIDRALADGMALLQEQHRAAQTAEPAGMFLGQPIGVIRAQLAVQINLHQNNPQQ